ncbi:MAG: hypothetical protein ABI779_02115 [Acidobacteriota bacterium]
MIAVLVFPTCAYAWSGREHAWIGSEAYAAACRAVAAGMQSLPADENRTSRYQVACRAVPPTPGVSDEYTLQGLFGDWSAIAGDHSDEPTQLTDLMLSDVVADYRKFARRAMTNYRHFHPAVTASWRGRHLQAVDAVVNASSTSGPRLQEAYESALAYEAFAQHYLQDSFAAGHMGFNRVASSNAAALSYHNRASKSGRCVANLRGEVWHTYGDDHLAETKETWSHVLESSSLSLAHFIAAFVDGMADDKTLDTIAATLPAFVKETGSPSQAGCEFDGHFVSLRGVNMPAQTATTWDVWFVRDATAYYEKPTMSGIMVGGSMELAPINIGYRTIQNRVQVGIGRTYSESGGHALLFDTQYLWQVGSSAKGLITHEVGLGEGDYWIPHAFEMLHIRAIYNMNVEAGGTYMRIHVALARSSFRWGPYVGIGFGSVRRASR